MAVKRLRVILGAVILLCIVFISKSKYDAKTPATPLQLEETNGKGEPIIVYEPTPEQASQESDSNKATEPPTFHLEQDAHRLASADDFLPHFEAVRQLPALTISEAKQTCTWPPDTFVNFQYADDSDWVKTDRSDSEIALRRSQWQDFVSNSMIPYAQVRDKFSGRGLVVCAGNQDTLSRLKVILRALKKLNSEIAMEVHYWADEIDDATKHELSTLYHPNSLYFNDLAGPHNILQVKKDQPFINYQLKTASVINSRFAEPLLLDSDNIPLLPPESLYTSTVYTEYGTVFWPDIARTRPQNPIWAITNTRCSTREYEQESGQLLVDKRRFWYHLQLAVWLNNDQGAYYNGFLLGDKDMFRFAWHTLKTAYGRPRKWLASVGVQNAGYYCGHSFAQHHPDDGRVAFLHGGLVKTVDLQVMRWNRDVMGGYYRHYKRALQDEEPGVSVSVAIKFDGAEYLPDKGEGVKVAQCTDMEDVEARDINEIVFGFEETFREIGGYWQLDEKT
ncbi:glycosyltransferase family 71 protein [Lophiostoma macrostomum CBS 122681]|uniref:Glycosyltransferase family 71 protein n=1 Tax=Lophiostoma macrostomum CBS 122681 TaxID=1314788 RepID=A0A6A6TH36_9PLEO|nr:glycosyltransferase family 71 protein [Lophiostoma macrostomum CBS 122681]